MVVLISLTTVWAALLNIGTTGWWTPMLGGGLAIFGLYLKRTIPVDGGFLLLASGFFLSFRTIPFSYANFIFILSTYFVFFGLWIFTRRTVLIKKLEKEFVIERKDKGITEYREDTAFHYVKTLLLSFLVSLTGGLIALHSFIGPFTPGLRIYLRILFSLAVLGGIYIILILLPRHFATTSVGVEED